MISLNQKNTMNLQDCSTRDDESDERLIDKFRILHMNDSSIFDLYLC